MGYYVHIDEGEWTIKETPEALAAVREMPRKFKAIQRGGSSNGEKWFSWMNDIDIENAESVESVFQKLGFETRPCVLADGTKAFELTAYDSKIGQEELFLAVMAPYSVDGSWLHWEGEDRAHWKYSVSQGRMFYSEGQERVYFDHAAPYAYQHHALVADEFRNLILDPANPDEGLKVAEEWNRINDEHWAKKRAEAQKEVKV